ncbi:MAG: hypothetical protein V4559_02575 [Pseudomonadota bacterium]
MDDKPADRARQERQLDEALKETFPASDPVAIQYIGSQTDMPMPDQVRQRLARRRLRSLIERHDLTTRP